VLGLCRNGAASRGRVRKFYGRVRCPVEAPGAAPSVALSAPGPAAVVVPAAVAVPAAVVPGLAVPAWMAAPAQSAAAMPLLGP
jgi:hypothetical protein